jgi:hypothetical protein
MPRGDFLGARNMGLPARTRATPTAAAGVLDAGRSLHPTNWHPSRPRLASSGTLFASRGRPASSASRYTLSPTHSRRSVSPGSKNMHQVRRVLCGAATARLPASSC